MALLSQKAVEANRRNAQHSTGPRTPEGKERSRANATTHGLSSVATIWRAMRNEDPAAFFELRGKLLAEHKPATAAEHLAIEMAAAAYMRIQRAEAMEVEYCDACKVAIQLHHGKTPHVTKNDYLGAALTTGRREHKLTWDTLDRWRKSAWSDYNKTIAQLMKLQKERVLMELRELRLHDQYQKYLQRTHVPTQRAEKSKSSASFRHRDIAGRILGQHWRKNGLHPPRLRQTCPTRPVKRTPAPARKDR